MSDHKEKSGMEIAKQLGEDAIGNLPFGTAVTNLLKSGYNNRQAKKFQSLLSHAFEGKNDQEVVEALKDEEAMELFLATARRMHEDDESAKARVYGKAFKVLSGNALRGPQFSEEFRWDFLDAIKQLKLRELFEMCKLAEDAQRSVVAYRAQLKADDPEFQRKSFEWERQVWESCGQYGGVNGDLAHRLLTLGLLSPRLAQQPPMPKPLMQHILAQLKPEIHEAFYEAHRHKPMMNFNAQSGQYDEQKVPPADGWTKQELGIPEK